MKKQVTFAESQTVHSLRQDDALSRCTEANGSKSASKDLARGPNSGSRISRPPPATCEPQLQPETTTQIPKSMSAAPFLKHSALTPAQKDYLYSLTASYSSAHVRNLITQHYLNVLHRRVRTGHNPEAKEPDETFPETDEGIKIPSDASCERKKNKKTKTMKSQMPSRLSSTSASKQRKKLTTTRRGGIRLSEEEEGLDESLSECLRSVSVAGWDEDTLSDLNLHVLNEDFV